MNKGQGQPQRLSRRGRGPPQEQKPPSSAEAEEVGEENPPDWTRFDIKVSLKNLCSNNMNVVRTELRKLHLRWWHASEPKMHHVLRNVGIEPKRLAMIKAIVDTCRECRAWQPAGNTVLPSVNLPERWLQAGECDLLFYKGVDHIAFHIMDRALRYGDGEEITGKSMKDLTDAYTTVWYQRYGAFQTLYCDGEAGLNCDEAKKYLRSL